MKETITMSEIKTVSTWSVKDDSPRGCKTVSNSEVKPGDKVVYDNRFTLVIDDPEIEPETPTEIAQEKADRKNWETCKRIAEELDRIAEGNSYRCPNCGEIVAMNDEQDDEKETRHTCPCCGETFDEDDAEPFTLWDYFADALDIEYRCGADRKYRSVEIMIACGGPNIYVDTAEKAVSLYWWSDRARYSLLSDTAEAIDDISQEYFNC